MRKTAVSIVGAIGAMALLAGCGTGGGGELTYDDSPLNEYMSAMWGGNLSPEEQEAQWAEQNRLREEAIAECMTDEGFEYIPVDSSGGIIITDEEDDPWKPDDRDWVAQYGYGMVNSPGMEEEMPVEEEGPVDPNQEYIESLSESEMQAYYEVLYGPEPPEEAYEDEDFDWDSWDRGCQAAGDEAVGDDSQALYESEEFKPLFTAIEEFYTSAQENEGMAELQQEWSSCMADAGHPGFETQMAAQESIIEKTNAFWEDYTDYENDPTETPEMQAIAEEEVELALADLDCREKTDFRQEELRIQFELEEQFIAEHKAELDALKAAAEQANE